jgi:primase-polymerase (primpol)-like protein
VISRPTTQQLIDSVCEALSEKVAPTITDPGAAVQLEMALAVLRTAAVRSGNEIAWMRDEREAIDAAARSLVDSIPESTALAAALAAYDAGRTDGLTLDEAQADYALASEVMSCAIEAAFASGDAAHIATVGALVDQRHANQQAVTGQFMAAGRA